MILQLPPSFQSSTMESRLTCELSQEARDFTAEDNRRKGVRRSRRKKAAAMEERKRMKAVKNKEKAFDDNEERLCLIVDTVGPDLHGINNSEKAIVLLKKPLLKSFPLIYCQRKLEDHQPPPLLQIELQNVDIFSVVDRCSGGGDGERSAGEEGARSMIIE
ncbi:hypothetical protein HID58_090077 [Brassica napus]|uniref:Uncharacterized protein n=1 Tax=Brassica napus TaxID=3708 RepID=A0ABQ7XGX4_BRANA|nr:hypothetical protein HID58_090077 [Brassica napus]